MIQKVGMLFAHNPLTYIFIKKLQTSIPIEVLNIPTHTKAKHMKTQTEI